MRGHLPGPLPHAPAGPTTPGRPVSAREQPALCRRQRAPASRQVLGARQGGDPQARARAGRPPSRRHRVSAGSQGPSLQPPGPDLGPLNERLLQSHCSQPPSHGTCPRAVRCGAGGAGLRSSPSVPAGVYAFGFLFMLPQLFVNYKVRRAPGAAAWALRAARSEPPRVSSPDEVGGAPALEGLHLQGQCPARGRCAGRRHVSGTWRAAPRAPSPGQAALRVVPPHPGPSGAATCSPVCSSRSERLRRTWHVGCGGLCRLGPECTGPGQVARRPQVTPNGRFLPPCPRPSTPSSTTSSPSSSPCPPPTAWPASGTTWCSWSTCTSGGESRPGHAGPSRGRGRFAALSAQVQWRCSVRLSGPASAGRRARAPASAQRSPPGPRLRAVA